nr:hypothetical protein [Desulfobacterales bacterium]
MAEEGVKIRPPQGKASAPQTEEVIIVCIDREGRTSLGIEEVSVAVLFDRPHGGNRRPKR